MEVVEITTVLGFILDAGDAGAGKGVGRESTVGEVSTDLRIDIGTGGPAKFWSCCYLLLANSIFGLWTSVNLAWRGLGGSTHASVGAERTRFLSRQVARVNRVLYNSITQYAGGVSGVNVGRVVEVDIRATEQLDVSGTHERGSRGGTREGHTSAAQSWTARRRQDIGRRSSCQIRR